MFLCFPLLPSCPPHVIISFKRSNHFHCHHLLVLHSTGTLIMDLSSSNSSSSSASPVRAVPLFKSDSSSLYLTRDIMAAENRARNFQFDKMYYLVEQGQKVKSLKCKLTDREKVTNWHMRMHGACTAHARLGLFSTTVFCVRPNDLKHKVFSHIS